MKDRKQYANAYELAASLRTFIRLINSQCADAMEEADAYIEGTGKANRAVHLSYAFVDSLKTFADAIDSAVIMTEAEARATGAWRK